MYHDDLGVFFLPPHAVSMNLYKIIFLTLDVIAGFVLLSN